jgi:hypothetical protein
MPFRREHRDKFERLSSHIQKSVRYSRRDLHDVGGLDRERLVTYPVLGATLKQHVRLFDIVHVKVWPAVWVRLGNDKRERLEPIIITSEAVPEFTWDAVEMLKLFELEEVIIAVEGHLRWVVEIGPRQRRLGRGLPFMTCPLWQSGATENYEACQHHYSYRAKEMFAN